MYERVAREFGLVCHQKAFKAIPEFKFSVFVLRKTSHPLRYGMLYCVRKSITKYAIRYAFFSLNSFEMHPYEIWQYRKSHLFEHGERGLYREKNFMLFLRKHRIFLRAIRETPCTKLRNNKSHPLTTEEDTDDGKGKETEK